MTVKDPHADDQAIGRDDELIMEPVTPHEKPPDGKIAKPLRVVCKEGPCHRDIFEFKRLKVQHAQDPFTR